MGALSSPKRYMGCAGNGETATIYAVEEDGGVWGESMIFYTPTSRLIASESQIFLRRTTSFEKGPLGTIFSKMGILVEGGKA